MEAQESRVRVAGKLQSVKRVGDVLPDPRQEAGDFACDGRLKKIVSKDVRSYAGATRAWGMMELRFVGNESQPPMTYVHRGDNIVCSPQAIWIVHSVPIEPQFKVTFGSIDEHSLREEGGAVWFDRIEVKLETRGGIKRTVAARETFKVQLPPT